MMKKPLPLIFIAFPILFFYASTSFSQNKMMKPTSAATLFNKLKTGFATVPDSIQTSIYWYWISDNISKEGVVKDLQAMKRAGINRAFIGNIGLPNTAYGKVKIFSDEWWDILHTALKTATQLNIEIGIFNSPGWSQSGGPWIKPDQSMRYLASSRVEVTGPKHLKIALDKPAKEFEDVRLIAFPKPKDFDKKLSDYHPEISSIPSVENLGYCMDNDLSTQIPLTNNLIVDFKTKELFTVRSITFYPLHRAMKVEGEIQVKQNGVYHSIRSFLVDRSNVQLKVGFTPYAPAVITIPATTAKEYRIVFTNVSSGSGVKDIKLSESPRVENYAEKSLAKMFPTPLPYWKEYQWPSQPVVKEKDLVIDPLKIKDISGFLAANGELNWSVPDGEWIIMRLGMTPTGVTNSPATPEATGLEVDKMSKKHVAEHFNAFLGEIIKRIPEEDRKTWKVVVQDSYETGGQNWTDQFIEKFTKQFGYNPLPYVPAMMGLVVGSQDMSDRFLWDLRRFVANEIAYEYVAGLREVSHKHGLHTWLENYGHWGFPGEFLMYGGQSDEIGGEFWSEGTLGDIENRAASSSAHIYGKTKVSAESFTDGAGNTFARYPAVLKKRGDRFFTEGINSTLLHVYIHQPYEDKNPGVNAWFGNEFNRKNTWFNDLYLFNKYLKRCNMMLQQGKYVADVAYFIGEDAPKMTGVRDPEIPKGYSYDYINADVIEKRVSVKDGKLVLPDGMSYRILVLPKLETMRPELLRKVKELVTEGAVVLGPKPHRSPSLQNYPRADAEIKTIAEDLWGNVDGKSILVNHYGKGLVIEGMDMQQALNYINVIPDYLSNPEDSTLFIHRKLKDGDMYFISNQTEKTISIVPQFRVTGKQPEFWNPANGTSRELPSYSINGDRTSVPIKLDPSQSAFIVFNKSAKRSGPMDVLSNFPNPVKTKKIEGSWQVKFDYEMRGPKNPVQFNGLTDWALNQNDSIKYYSGTAVYTKMFSIEKTVNGERVFLDLGNLIAIAKVKVNGKYVGGVWAPPYKVDITGALKQGNNKLEISVVNNWKNRLIGDLNLPEKERKTWVSVNPYKPNTPLQTSGLLGPVTLEWIKY